MLLATLLGGQRYFYCRMMNEVMSPAECACATPIDRQEQVAIGASHDCLELRTLDRLHSYTVGADWVVPPASLVATLPAPLPACTPEGRQAVTNDHPIRAGPESPAAARARLMVFLT